MSSDPEQLHWRLQPESCRDQVQLADVVKALPAQAGGRSAQGRSTSIPTRQCPRKKDNHHIGIYTGLKSPRSYEGLITRLGQVYVVFFGPGKYVSLCVGIRGCPCGAPRIKIPFIFGVCVRIKKFETAKVTIPSPITIHQDPPCTLNWRYMVPNSRYLGPKGGWEEGLGKDEPASNFVGNGGMDYWKPLNDPKP